MPVTKAKRRRQIAVLLAAGKMHRCKYCGCAVRNVEVLVGRDARPVQLWIDRFPDRDGVVIKRRDGKYRLLREGRKPMTGLPAFRVHTPKECASRTPCNPEEETADGPH